MTEPTTEWVYALRCPVTGEVWHLAPLGTDGVVLMNGVCTQNHQRIAAHVAEVVRVPVSAFEPVPAPVDPRIAAVVELLVGRYRDEGAAPDVADAILAVIDGATP